MAKHSSREFPPQRYRDGVEQRYFDDYEHGAVSPVTVLIDSSRFEFVGARNCVAEICRTANTLDVVKGQGYFAYNARGREVVPHLVRLRTS